MKGALWLTVHLRVVPLVRAISATSSVILTEWSHPCEVIVKAKPENTERGEVRISTRTITVGGHYYAAPALVGLQAGTWYTYRLSVPSGDQETGDLRGAPLQCLRTLDAPSLSPATLHPFRLAYASCRNLGNP